MIFLILILRLLKLKIMMSFKEELSMKAMMIFQLTSLSIREVAKKNMGNCQNVRRKYICIMYYESIMYYEIIALSNSIIK